jgi:hypothetical protein
VVFPHGFLEISYLWRHQMLAAARRVPRRRAGLARPREEEVLYDDLLDDLLGILDLQWGQFSIYRHTHPNMKWYWSLRLIPTSNSSASKH